MMAKPLYHYTTGVYAPLILQSGAILPSTKRTLAPGEIPLVWCSFHPRWEPTAAKGLAARTSMTGEIVLLRTLTMEEHERATLGIVRFQVDPPSAPMNWDEACAFARTPPELVVQMERRALALGADKDDWRATAAFIPAKYWLGLEVFDFAAKQWRRSPSPTLDRELKPQEAA